MGSRDDFVSSGSDDGRIFIWSQHTGRLVNILTSDDQNVTCVVAHPSMPVLASAGSDPTIKLWSPQVPYPPPRLLLGTTAPVMMPNGVDFSFVSTTPTIPMLMCICLFVCVCQYVYVTLLYVCVDTVCNCLCLCSLHVFHSSQGCDCRPWAQHACQTIVLPFFTLCMQHRFHQRLLGNSSVMIAWTLDAVQYCNLALSLGAMVSWLWFHGCCGTHRQSLLATWTEQMPSCRRTLAS